MLETLTQDAIKATVEIVSPAPTSTAEKIDMEMTDKSRAFQKLYTYEAGESQWFVETTHGFVRVERWRDDNNKMDVSLYVMAENREHIREYTGVCWSENHISRKAKEFAAEVAAKQSQRWRDRIDEVARNERQEKREVEHQLESAVKKRDEALIMARDQADSLTNAAIGKLLAIQDAREAISLLMTLTAPGRVETTAEQIARCHQLAAKYLKPDPTAEETK